MAQFSYKARRRSGEIVEGMLEVADRGAALVQIDRLGLFPVAVDAAKAGAAAVPERPAGAKTDWRAMLPPSLRVALSQKRKPKLQELATFTQQMANLLHSGMPLTVARRDSNSELCARAAVGTKNIKPHRVNAALRRADADRDSMSRPPSKANQPPS